VDTKGRQPFHRARCSIEMRFRVRVDMHAARAAETGLGPGPGAETGSGAEAGVEGDIASASEAGSRVDWGPFSAAVASGKFRTDGLRDSEAKYDLREGRMAS